MARIVVPLSLSGCHPAPSPAPAARSEVPAPRTAEPAPVRDWRAHIEKAFARRTAPTFAAPDRDAFRTLAEVCRQPPSALLSFLAATDGLMDNDDVYRVFYTAREIVENTREVREYGRTLKDFVAIGGPGIDGIRFVMRQGTESDAVQVYHPIGDELFEEPGESLWDFVRSWGERTVEF